MPLNKETKSINNKFKSSFLIKTIRLRLPSWEKHKYYSTFGIRIFISLFSPFNHWGHGRREKKKRLHHKIPDTILVNIAEIQSRRSSVMFHRLHCRFRVSHHICYTGNPNCFKVTSSHDSLRVIFAPSNIYIYIYIYIYISPDSEYRLDLLTSSGSLYHVDLVTSIRSARSNISYYL